jgi:hypothetical protein
MLVKHLIVPLRAMILTCMHLIFKENKAPAKSWRMLAMNDAAVVLERLLDFLSPTTILMELVQVLTLLFRFITCVYLIMYTMYLI